MKSTTIKTPQENDELCKQLVEIDQSRVTPENDFSWPKSSYESEFLSASSELYLWNHEDVLSGFVFYRLNQDLECEVMHLACKAKGMGAVMLTAWMSGLKQMGAKRVFLDCHTKNQAAIKLYSKLGFVKIEERANYYKDGGAAINMSYRF